MSFSFPDSVKVKEMVPTTIQREGLYLVLTQRLRVTFINPWDYSRFPFDTRTLSVRMSTSLASVLEPVTLKMDPVSLPDNLFGFSPKSKLSGSIVKEAALGPQGVWGQAQMIELKASLSRAPGHEIVHMLLPVMLCSTVTYGGFFLRIHQLLARFVSAIIALLVLFLMMSVISGSKPEDTGLVWLEHWLGIQMILVAIACCHHLVCQYIYDRYGETKYVHLDTCMRICFPVVFVLSFLWAESIVAWNAVGYAVISSTALLSAIMFGVIFTVLERRAARYEEKTYFPGI
jgi:hypothetical protein